MQCSNGHNIPEGHAFCGVCGQPAAVSTQYAAQVPGAPTYVINQVVPTKAMNGLAIASMVLGIVWVYWIGSILAVIFGAVALKQIRERNENGKGMAIAGLVLGLVGLGFLVILLIIGLVAN